MSERNVWLNDSDPAKARRETAFTALGAEYLLRVHLALHQGLDLPRLSADEVRSAHRAAQFDLSGLIAKASLGGMFERFTNEWSTAKRRFADLLRQGRAEAMAKIADEAARTWLQEGHLQNEAERQNVATFLTGYLRAKPPKFKIVPPPVTWRESGKLFRLGQDADNAMTWTALRGGEAIQSVSERTRQRIKQTVLSSMGAGEHPFTLAKRLNQDFAELNRDWRMVALTETHAAYANGQIAGTIGQTLEWVAAPDACEHCRKYHGKKFLAVAKPGNFATEMWPGKTNVGRSFSPSTREGRMREAHELAGPVIPAHPHCRCRLVAKKALDPRLEAALSALR